MRNGTSVMSDGTSSMSDAETVIRDGVSVMCDGYRMSKARNVFTSYRGNKVSGQRDIGAGRHWVVRYRGSKVSGSEVQGSETSEEQDIGATRDRGRRVLDSEELGMIVSNHLAINWLGSGCHSFLRFENVFG